MDERQAMTILRASGEHRVARTSGPTELPQVIETIKSCTMAVAEIEPESVIAHLLPADNGDAREFARPISTILNSENVTLPLSFSAR